jgi:hypothetical protein
MAISHLEQAVYGMAEADPLLRLRAGTAQRWIDGYERRGRVHAPVVRERRTGSASVTWGELAGDGDPGRRGHQLRHRQLQK